MATKHGYASKEEFVVGAQKKFSLLENGILDLLSTRLLLINVSDSLNLRCEFGLIEWMCRGRMMD
jgi:hypothetical protein